MTVNHSPDRLSELPPLAVDIDGTLTDPSGSGIDTRVFEPLREWDAPVVVATGQVLPYALALCRYLGIPGRAVAENGGIAHVDGDVEVLADAEAPARVEEEYREHGCAVESDGGGANRWRETEVAFHPDDDDSLLRDLADGREVEVVDTGYNYHVKDPAVDKGAGLRAVAEHLGFDPAEFVAIGDSANDVGAFEVAGTGYAVANADDAAKAAADVVLDGEQAEGFLEALDRIQAEFRPTPSG